MASTQKSNKAAVYVEPGSTKTRIEHLEVPVPGNGQVLVKL